MNDIVKVPDTRIQTLINNLKLRNINAFFLESLNEVNDKLIQMIPSGCTVGVGHSVTVQNSGIIQKLIERGNIVFDKTMAASKEESRQ